MAVVIFDANILIDALKGYDPAIDELTYWDDPTISAMTWMEVYSGVAPDEVERVDNFMEEIGFHIVPVDQPIMKAAAALCYERRLKPPKIKLPDAIIQVTAERMGATIVTRNTKDFKGAAMRVPYEIVATPHGIEFVNIATKPTTTKTIAGHPALTRKK